MATGKKKKPIAKIQAANIQWPVSLKMTLADIALPDGKKLKDVTDVHCFKPQTADFKEDKIACNYPSGFQYSYKGKTYRLRDQTAVQGSVEIYNYGKQALKQVSWYSPLARLRVDTAEGITEELNDQFLEGSDVKAICYYPQAIDVDGLEVVCKNPKSVTVVIEGDPVEFEEPVNLRIDMLYSKLGAKSTMMFPEIVEYKKVAKKKAPLFKKVTSSRWKKTTKKVVKKITKKEALEQLEARRKEILDGIDATYKKDLAELRRKKEAELKTISEEWKRQVAQIDQTYTYKKDGKYYEQPGPRRF